MVSLRQTPPSLAWHIPASRLVPILLISLVWLQAWADEEAPLTAIRATLVRVPVPIVGSVDQSVRASIERLVVNPEGSMKASILVLEFWPPSETSAGLGSEFERSLALARYLSSDALREVRTVAYLPRSVLGHAVLPILACDEIMMAPDAVLGAAGDGEANISTMMRGFYDEIADRRRTIPPAVALGMLDSRLEVLRITTPAGSRYVLREDFAKIRQEVNVQEVETIGSVGEAVRLTGNEMRLKYGFASHLVRDRAELATQLGVTVSDLQPDPSVGGAWVPIRIDLNGPISKSNVERVIRTIDEQIRSRDANFVCLAINSPGGSPLDSMELANFLAKQDAAKIRTVAYVGNQALADAALIAIACDQVVMEDDATLGGEGAYQPSRAEMEDLRISIRRLCEEKSKRWSIPIALVDSNYDVFRFTLGGTPLVEYFSEAEWTQLKDPDRWKRGEAITAPGVPLSLTGERAVELEIANFAVGDYSEFKRLYHLKDDPVTIKPTWADDFIAYLARPHVAASLLFFGGFALIIELSSPGIGVGAFVSVVCFVVFFWSQFLHGTASWLEIVLFVTGLAFIAVEIFVVPGFGVFGLGGAGLVIASLVLASQTFVLPANDYQFQQLPQSLMTVAAAGSGVVLGLVVLRRFMDRAPILNRMMLNPPDLARLSELEAREAVVRFDHYLGEVGVTTTALRPSGKVRFSDRILDVVSDGQAIDPGTRVRVIAVHGNRVVVSDQS